MNSAALRLDNKIDTSHQCQTLQHQAALLQYGNGLLLPHAGNEMGDIAQQNKQHDVCIAAHHSRQQFPVHVEQHLLNHEQALVERHVTEEDKRKADEVERQQYSHEALNAMREIMLVVVQHLCAQKFMTSQCRFTFSQSRISVINYCEQEPQSELTMLKLQAR